MFWNILQILVFIHEHRVINRDIKPGNIIRNKTDNHLVLIYFGTVKTMQPPTSEKNRISDGSHWYKGLCVTITICWASPFI